MLQGTFNSTHMIDAEIEWPIGQAHSAFKDMFSIKERKNPMLYLALQWEAGFSKQKVNQTLL